MICPIYRDFPKYQGTLTIQEDLFNLSNVLNSKRKAEHAN